MNNEKRRRALELMKKYYGGFVEDKIINLFPAPTSGGRTNSGITWTYNEDGTVTAIGTATQNSWSYGNNPPTNPPTVNLPAGVYTASVSIPFGLVVSNMTDGGYFYNGSDNISTFTLDHTTTIKVHARVARNDTVNATTGIMLEKGSTAHNWVPYKE